MTNPLQTPGAVSWVELMTTDVEAAKGFYGDLFGWELEQAPMEGVDYTLVKVGDRHIGGMMAMPEDMPQGGPPRWGIYVTVDDTDATVQKATELGGQVLVPPTDIPNVGRFAVIQDPQGAAISVMKYEPMP
jgi:predicted enzyme related to lactoylglutathione lyase